MKVVEKGKRGLGLAGRGWLDGPPTSNDAVGSCIYTDDLLQLTGTFGLSKELWAGMYLEDLRCGLVKVHWRLAGELEMPRFTFGLPRDCHLGTWHFSALRKIRLATPSFSVALGLGLTL